MAPNTRGESGNPILISACGPHGAVQAVEALLVAGADPNLAGTGGRTPLMEAASWLDAPTVELLLSRGADPLLKDSGGRTALDHMGHSSPASESRVRALLSRNKPDGT